MKRNNSPDTFLSDDEKQIVEQAVSSAEKITSAEIKLIILRHCWIDIRTKAERLLFKNGLDKTEDRNCVLIVLVTTNREFTIFGDKGIHEKAGESFWTDIRDVMISNFSENRFGDGLSAGIRRIGDKLAEFFPLKPDDVNEIPDEISYEDH